MLVNNNSKKSLSITELGVLSILFGLIKYLVMVVVGTVLNYYVDDPLLVGVLSFVAGLIIFRSRSKPVEQISPPQPITRTQPQTTRMVQPMKTSPMVSGVYCVDCGTKAVAGQRFCGVCGKKLVILKTKSGTNIVRYAPEDIMEQIRVLKGLYYEGNIERASYMNILKNSIFLDGWSRVWSIGANSLKWYRFERQNWIPDIPVGSLQISSK